MEASFSVYDFEKSIERISEILESSDASYEDRTGVPARDCLTFNNGFYVNVSVIFVDMRGSKKLAEGHTRPVLAKIYRSYISEVVAVLRGHAQVKEISIEGDGVWAVFDTTFKSQIDGAFSTACQVASLTDILNVKLKKKGYSTIKVGIGIDYGESLFIKAGYKGSGINEVVWLGKVVGNAAKLCKEANSGIFRERIIVSSVVYNNLNDQNQKMLSFVPGMDAYQGDIVNTAMNKWVEDNG